MLHDHAGGSRVVRGLVDDDETAGGAIARVTVDHQGLLILIDASEVWSSMRVAPRSVIRAAAVSVMISSMVIALDSTGKYTSCRRPS